MKTVGTIIVVFGFLWVYGMTVAPCLAFDFQDSAGDTPGPDITDMSYEVSDSALNIKLTFVQELAGSIINQDLIASIRLDIDQSMMTGFVGGGGLQPRFGADYEIEITLLGFGSTSNEAYLKYWRHKSSPPFVELEKVSVTLGNPFYPNGSIFVVGQSSEYGTNNHQIFLRIPLELFSNDFFPLCTDIMTLCVNQLFPCPLNLIRNLSRAYVNITVIDATWDPGVDSLPDQGMIDTATVTVKDYYPTGSEDLVATLSDPPDDCLAPPCNNGEEIIGLRAYLHDDSNLTLELKLETYDWEDTAAYHLLFDLDNNAATGQPLTNGSETLGVDLVAEYANFDNPVGEANPLEGVVYFWLDGAFCPLLYIDYLANVWRSNPGYVWVTIPREFMEPYLTSNQSGLIRVMGATFDPPVGFYVDLVPNDGFMQVELGDLPVIDSISFDECISELCTSSITITAHDPEGGGLTYIWEALDGGDILGEEADVEFDPLEPTVYPDCDPYRVKVTVTSSVSGLSAEETIDIYVKFAGDVNGDGVVNVLDKVQVRNHFGQSGDPGWVDADVNCDGNVNIVDKVIVRNQFGQTGCSCPVQ